MRGISCLAAEPVSFSRRTLRHGVSKYVNFRIAVTEMYPRILWKVVADPLGFGNHALGTTGIDELLV